MVESDVVGVEFEGVEGVHFCDCMVLCWSYVAGSENGVNVL